MSLHTTQFQGPVMAATREQSHVRISIRVPSVSSGQISAETEATYTLIALEVVSLPG